MENTSPSPSPTRESSDLSAQVSALNKLTTWLIICMLLIGGPFGLFLYHQVRSMNRQVTDAQKFIADYQTNSLPKIQWFVAALQTFARTNADFNPILAKYGLLPTNSAALAKPAAGPLPKK
jgi:hypothetical protein